MDGLLPSCTFQYVGVRDNCISIQLYHMFSLILLKRVKCVLVILVLTLGSVLALTLSITRKLGEKIIIVSEMYYVQVVTVIDNDSHLCLLPISAQVIAYH